MGGVTIDRAVRKPSRHTNFRETFTRCATNQINYGSTAGVSALPSERSGWNRGAAGTAERLEPRSGWNRGAAGTD